jgi:putative ABC transport system permease protein
VGRLVARDLRHRPLQAGLLLLAITAATTVLTLGLALHGVTGQPGRTDQAQIATQARTLGTLVVVAVLTSIPARAGARRPVADVLQSEVT